jgi:hypothetical protein
MKYVYAWGLVWSLGLVIFTLIRRQMTRHDPLWHQVGWLMQFCVVAVISAVVVIVAGG